MPAFFLYLIKVNIALIACYLLYYFLLRKLTFYTLNRWFLLSSIVLASLFPIVNFANLFVQQQTNSNTIFNYTPNWEYTHTLIENASATITVWSVLYFIYWIGVAAMIVYFLIQFISLLRIHLSTSKAIEHKNVRITTKNIQPFSFLKTIYVNPTKYDWHEVQTIIQHESVHTAGLHTIDIVIAEVNKIMYWFNPGVWLLKNAIRENLEFIADEKVLQAGKNVKEYQYELLQVITGINYKNGLANQFSLFHLKNRIMMMNKNKSSKWSKAKYLLLIPVLCIVAVVVAQSNINKVGKQESYVDFQKKVWETVGTSSKPIWIIDGIPVLVSKASMASFDKKEIDKDVNFKVYYDKQFYTMAEANEKFNRFDLKSVGAVSKQYSKSTFGLAVNLLIINGSTNNTNLSKSNAFLSSLVKNENDTIPISCNSVNKKGYCIEVHTPNGIAYAVAYDKNRKEVSRMDISGNKDVKNWEKKYGAIPVPPVPPPPPPVAPVAPPAPLKGIDKINGEVDLSVQTDNNLNIKTEIENAATELKNAQTELKNTATELKNARTEIEKSKIEMKKSKLEIEKSKLEIEKSKLEIEKSKLEIEKSKVEIENAKSDLRLIGNVKIKSNAGDNQPLILIDGQEKDKPFLDAMPASNIALIDVLKNKSATAMYGEKGKNGVIKVTTNKHANKNPPSSKSVESVELTFEPNKIGGSVTNKKSEKIFFKEGEPIPLIIIDGKIVEKKNLDTLNSDDIKSVNVFKGETAIAQYGNKGKNGVIAITTKKVPVIL